MSQPMARWFRVRHGEYVERSPSAPPIPISPGRVRQLRAEHPFTCRTSSLTAASRSHTIALRPCRPGSDYSMTRLVGGHTGRALAGLCSQFRCMSGGYAGTSSSGSTGTKSAHGSVGRPITRSYKQKGTTPALDAVSRRPHGATRAFNSRKFAAGSSLFAPRWSATQNGDGPHWPLRAPNRSG